MEQYEAADYIEKLKAENALYGVEKNERNKRVISRCCPANRYLRNCW